MIFPAFLLLAPLVTISALAPRAFSSSPAVNLGYATYQGYYNGTYDLNIWKSVRYAAPPVGQLRWQAPQAPIQNNTAITLAIDQPPLCPQTGAFGTPAIYGFNSGPGDEDCLYLNIYAPPNASNLPVFVWIHGGGYSDFGAVYDPSILMNTNNNAFITVEIQYRLGAFGYLASAEVKAEGQLNAGLLDQRFALEWVRQYIAKFGGDPCRVTIGGESSGAGSVMYQAMAYGGNQSELFTNIIAASPWTPTVYQYDDSVPTAHYNDFATLAGCGTTSQERSKYQSTFACLVAANTTVLQNASGTVSTTEGYFGSFGFLPVVDGHFIQERPSVQLHQGQVSGKRILVGNNENEGVPLTNPNVVTRAAYDAFVNTTFPLFTATDVVLLDSTYQIQNSQPGDTGIRYDTNGTQLKPTALTESEMATGIQQTVFDISAESTFDCPAQWLAQAFSQGWKQSWKYQYSVTPAYHGADLSAYFSVGATVPNADFRHAFQKIWGNFIIHDNPVISVADATANQTNSTVPVGTQGNINWPQFSMSQPWQMDLNTTGGTVSLVTVTSNLSYYERNGPGIVNVFSLADAYSWEGGRGARCDFWLGVSSRVPY